MPKVKGIEKFRQLLDNANEGDEVGLLLEWCEVAIGDVLEIR